MPKCRKPVNPKRNKLRELLAAEKPLYGKLVACCKKHRDGIAAADLTAKTALPLETVRTLLPVCADEYRARLRVTESGEILYSFPHGFTSRYRGFGPAAGRFFDKAGAVLRKIAATLFKVWILVMLVGYFLLFIAIALAAVLASVAVQSQSKNENRSSRGNSGGVFFVGHIFELIIRIWFYSELFKPYDRYGRRPVKPKSRPLYKAVFSFVFGDGDLNADIAARENRAVLAYIQEAGGVISLSEYMILTGKPPVEAEDAVTRFCASYGGSPEVSDDGVIFYRFDDLMLRQAGTGRKTLYSGPLRKLNAFSSNEPKFNRWFCVLNGVNLLFGGYFLWNALSMGRLEMTEAALQAAIRESYLYTFVYHFLEVNTQVSAYPVLFWGLGFVPLAFSAFFWLIPLFRKRGLDKSNEEVKLYNLRQSAFNNVWQKPHGVSESAFDAAGAESRPGNLPAARKKLVAELSAYARVEVRADDAGNFSYDFDEIGREKASLERERAGAKSAGLGGVVFDSGA